MKDIEFPEPDAWVGMAAEGSIIVSPSERQFFNAYAVFTAEQMRTYARAAVEADRAQRVPDGYSEDQIAQAAMEAEIPDSKLESLLIALASTPAQPAQQTLPEAMKTVIAEMQSDPDYAWTWHCNVAMAMVDAGCDPVKANQGAARFMRVLANVEPAHELPSAPAQQEPVLASLTAMQALEALDELESSARGDEPFNHFAAPLIRQYIESSLVSQHQEPPSAPAPAQQESPCACWPGRRMCSRSNKCADDVRQAAHQEPPQPVERKPIGYVPISAVEEVALDGYLPVYKDHDIRE